MRTWLSKMHAWHLTLAKHWRFLIVFCIILFLLFVAGTSALLAYGATYSHKVLPGVHVGEFGVEGLTQQELRNFLDQMTIKRFNEGVKVSFDSPNGAKQFVYNPGPSVVPGAFGVSIDVTAETTRIYNYGKIDNLFVDSWSALINNFLEPHLQLSTLQIQNDQFYSGLDKKFAEYKKEAVNADVVIKKEDPLQYTITTSSLGFSFDYGQSAEQVMDAWKNLAAAQVSIASHVIQPEVTEKDLDNVKNQLEAVFAAGPHTIAHYDAHAKRSYSWTISKKQIADWVRPIRRADTSLSFGLDASSTAAFVKDKVAPQINVEPKDAVFELNSAGTKAKNIVGHRPGATVDTKKVLADINDAFATRISGEKSVTKTTLAVAVVDPKVKLGSTNNLGINEVLGTGYSNFSGSPRNRILNIKNAVINKLHGTIVKPDEEFSLVATLKPFTLEAGYLPELVIVGDRIKPEIAGGLCQVGTTMFRSAMNSGMPITQRVNHGLVVSYYNDPSNGKPGTDATIYDSWPDFRFKNDTGHSIAITVSMNESTKDLSFTFWGTSDGRKGYYTPPVVDSWISAGPYKEILTTDMAPGKKECQSVHPGAKTHFTYTREFKNGEKENRVFSSVYRAVPATCYVGVSEIPAIPVCKEGEDCSAKPDDGIVDGAEKPKEDKPVTADDLGIVFPAQ